jgi:hypothetical protein
VAIQGDTAVVAAVGDVAGARGVHVFKRNNATGVWNHTAELEPVIAGSTMFGFSVAITDDESNIVVGSPSEPGTSNKGAVYIFARDTTDAWSVSSEFRSDDVGVPLDEYFGRTVSVDGDIMVVSGASNSGASTDKAYAYVFKRDSTWTPVAWLHDFRDGWQETAPAVVRSDMTIPGYQEAYENVAVSGDTVVVGEELFDALDGIVWVFTPGGPSPWQNTGFALRHILRPSTYVKDDGKKFGRYVAFAGDVVAVASGSVEFSEVFVFCRDGEESDAPWTERAILKPYEDGTELSTETPVGLATDGDAVFVSSSSGNVLVYKRVRPGDAASEWTLTSRLEKAVDENDFRGYVAVNKKRRGEVIVGAPGATVSESVPDTGAAYIFASDAYEAVPANQASIVVVEKVFSDALAVGNGAGAAVAVSGDTMVVGIPGGANFGAVKVYVRDVPGDATSTWTLESTLQAPSSQSWSTDAFGSAVAIDGDHLAVGDNENNHAYAFVRDGTTWNLAGNANGTAVAIGDGILVIGDHVAEVARVYARVGTAWNSVADVTPVSGSGIEFGRSVATRNGVVVIGSIDEGNVIAVDCDTAACSAGTSLKPPYGISGFGNLVAVDADADGNSVVVVSGVFADGDRKFAAVYSRDAGAWSEPAILFPDNDYEHAEFGHSGIAVRGDVIVVSSAAADSAGAAFVYRRVARTLSAETDVSVDGVNVDDVSETPGSGTSNTTSNTTAPAPPPAVTLPPVPAPSPFKWVLVSAITPEADQHGSPVAGDMFGRSVAVYGDNVFVGAPGDDFGKTRNAGSVYVFAAQAPPPEAPLSSPPPSMSPPSQSVDLVPSPSPAPMWTQDGYQNLTRHFAPSDALTFEAWIRPTSVDKTQFIASLGNYGWGVALMCGSGVSCCGNHLDGSIGFWTHASADRQNCENTYSSNVSVVVDTWQHIAVTVLVEPVEEDALGFSVVGDSVIRFYVDGAPAGEFVKHAEAENKIQILNGTRASSLYFGRFGACNCMHYQGLIDEVKLWNAAVLGRVIKQHRGNWTGGDAYPETWGVLDWHPNYDKVIAWYKFDTAHEYVVIDKIGDINGEVHTSDDQSVLWDNASYVNVLTGLVAPPSPPMPPSPPPAQSGPSSLRFNGVDSFAKIAHDDSAPFHSSHLVGPFVPDNALTFEAWIKPSRLDRVQHVAGLGDGGWAVRTLCPTGGGLIDGLTEEQRGCCKSGIPEGAIGFYSGRSCEDEYVSDVGVTLNEWNHIAVVVDLASSSIRFFVNGTSAGETSYADTDFPDGGDAHMSFGAHIARDSAGDETRSRYYQGWLDEVRMWFAPLEASTIAANKNLSFVSWHPNGDALLAYYKFDQASGNVAYEYFHTAGYNAIIRSSDDSNVLWDITEIPSIEVPGSPAVMSPPPSPSPSPPPPPVPPPVSPPPPGRFQEQAGDAAVYFDGAGAFGVVAHSARLKDAVVNQALTVEAWIRPEEGEGFSRAQTIVALGELGWGVQLMCPEGAGLGCCGSHLDGALGFFADGDAASDVTLCERVMSSNASVPYGEWSHVAVVVDPRGHRRELAAHEIQHAAREVSASSSSGYGKRRLLSTESRGELESLFRRLARPTTRARGSGDAVSDTAPGASRSLLFFGGGDTAA